MPICIPVTIWRLLVISFWVRCDGKGVASMHAVPRAPKRGTSHVFQHMHNIVEEFGTPLRLTAIGTKVRVAMLSLPRPCGPAYGGIYENEQFAVRITPHQPFSRV